MAEEPFYRDRWINIDPEKLERYQVMFRWNPASSVLYEAATIGPGQIVGELGSGPGHTAIEIASWVGSEGHVHAMDINSDFVSQTRDNAKAAGLGDRVTAHLCDGSALPLPDGALDRLTARNTIIYVDDVDHTFREIRRVLKTGGKVHAIEGDWPMMLVEPVPSKSWAKLIEAASHACRTPDIGRKLRGLMASAGFSEIDVQVITRPDTDGRLLPMIKNMAGFARGSGTLASSEIDAVLSTIDQAISDGTFMALAPQFVVTATR